MPQPEPQLTNRLKKIQSRLGVAADGVLGPETLSALELELGVVAGRSATHLQCSRRGLDLILEFEVGSPRRYERDYQSPLWPGGQSGVTVGIGYDLGMTAAARIREDWSGLLDEAILAALLAAQGVVGEEARPLVRGLSRVRIPFAAAAQVFYTRTLPRFAELTRRAFPGVQKLPPDAQAMLLSLVYNRGDSTTGSRRREMAEIQRLLRAPRPSLPAIANEFEAMRRLWPELPGLQQRRRREAEVIRAARRPYAPEEIVRV